MPLIDNFHKSEKFNQKMWTFEKKDPKQVVEYSIQRTLPGCRLPSLSREEFPQIQLLRNNWICYGFCQILKRCVRSTNLVPPESKKPFLMELTSNFGWDPFHLSTLLSPWKIVYQNVCHQINKKSLDNPNTFFLSKLGLWAHLQESMKCESSKWEL